MAVITWDQTGSRNFESGIDRGVLYSPEGGGVAWNGLTSMSAHTPNTIETVYYDGVKVNDLVTVGDFQGSLKAYTYPSEFTYYEGMLEAQTGFFITGQGPKPFHLSYRTKIGNDVAGQDLAYKLHLLWNITATPALRTYDTLALDTTVPIFEWALSAVPEDPFGYRPSAYLIVDSRTANSTALTNLQNKLWGTAGTAPVMPTMQEVIDIT